jgi:hypothetical protein
MVGRHAVKYVKNLKKFCTYIAGGCSVSMGILTIKTPIYWGLIEFIDWRYSQSCWFFGFFNLLCELWLALLHPPPPPRPLLPCVNKYMLYTRIQGVRGRYWVIGGVRATDGETPPAKSIYWSNFLDNDIWHCFLSV